MEGEGGMYLKELTSELKSKVRLNLGSVTDRGLP